jgi:hypothetical protein
MSSLNAILWRLIIATYSRRVENGGVSSRRTILDPPAAKVPHEVDQHAEGPGGMVVDDIDAFPLGVQGGLLPSNPV